MRFADVILPVPFETFTYIVPDALSAGLVRGSRVVVPLGKNKHYAGIVARLHTQQPADVQLKEIERVADAQPVVNEQQFQFWQWIADYYMSPLGDVYKAAFPSRLKDGEAPTPKRTRRTIVDRMAGNAGAGITHPLSPAQQTAFDQIVQQWAGGQTTVLLHGVTSSGKTEIYIHLIQRALDAGQQVLYLLPEIALTTQITDRLRHVFGSRLGVYHSKFTDAEREAIYRHQLSAEPYDVILGARSSIFLPFQRLGLIIVDEEHETSYKQQDPQPRYHARNAALVLARQFGATTLLGTATPSIETYHLAQEGRYGYVPLTERFRGLELPRVEVVDIKRLRFQKRMKGAFSPRLVEAITEALAHHEQAILFLNRRGFSNLITCNRCGWVPHCQHCDVSLTLHKRSHTLVCHYCGAVYQLPEHCPSCHSYDTPSAHAPQPASLRPAPAPIHVSASHDAEERFVPIGAGTERIEEQIARLFPAARLLRMDLDTAKTRAAYEKIVGDFAAGEADILIGTQMVTKGLDFDHVSVVGILDADTMLNVPDFRSYERTFHLLSQVAGRAGRKGRQGTVILQTRSADLPLIQQVVDNDFEGMYRDQLAERELFRYPPFTRLIYVFLRHRDNDILEHLAEDFAKLLRQRFPDMVLGPDRPAVSRVQSLFIRKIMLKVPHTAPPAAVRQSLHDTQRAFLERFAATHVNIYFDADPM